ncbi:MAG: hypothetical protein GC190_00410 [Alphaproteobacteria bacterium]|nr:hypothetical protein [Alphaproteobacteria bacterium]
MSDAIVQSSAEVAANAEQAARRILDDIGGLQRKQAELHSQYSAIQELDPRSPQLDGISRVMDETSRVVGALARQRTELLDGLPTITDAQGRLCVVADQLVKDSRLVERVKERLQSVTKTIATAEQLLIKVAALVA